MILRTPLFLLALSGTFLAAQTAPNPTSPRSPTAAGAGAKIAGASVTVQPSLDILNTALRGISVERWKGSSAIRGEAENNLKSIRNDVSTTLPALLATADAAPGSSAKLLPAYRNVDALYDVVLRVDAAARISAPSNQSSALDQALASLEDSRRTLGDQLQRATEAQEMQVGRLQAALRAVPPPAPIPPPPAPAKCPTTPARKKRPAAKPATAAKGSSVPAHQ